MREAQALSRELAAYGHTFTLPALYLVAAVFSLAFCSIVSAQEVKPVYRTDRYTVWADRVQEGAYVARALSPTEIESNYPVTANAGESPRKWTLQADLISQYPQTSSDYLLLDALYNLSLEELARDTRADGALNAGAKWQGVWTRDVSYSIVLSLAAVAPEAAKASLLQKVKRDRIVQDTGTGGSWPVSTDRMTWALAAWEIYLVTGDQQWLTQSYAVIRNSMLDDLLVVIDPVTGLARGESSFLDWREQTYPRWMEPADIYASKEIGTNAVYYRTFCILAAMAHQLGQPAKEWESHAERIHGAFNKQFWVKDRGYYGAYLYGRLFPSVVPRAGALGESLSILFDLAGSAQQQEILRSQPIMEYGIPTVYPQTPNVPPYHNRSVWPFVQGFWNLAAAKHESGSTLLEGLAAIYRQSALFLTNKENFVLDTGSPLGTEINSDRQLWSVAANLAMTYKVLFGMRFEEDGLHLEPVIPEPLGGARRLTNFHYRQAILSIEVNGFGGKVKTFLLDGKPSSSLIPASTTGNHTVTIDMDNQPLRSSPTKLATNITAPETPQVRLDDDKLKWEPIKGAVKYKVFRNASLVSNASTPEFAVAAGRQVSEYQVSAVDQSGTESFLSVPVLVNSNPLTLAAVPGSPEAYVTLDRDENKLSIAGDLPASGTYQLSFRYANGSGPINTENKCAIRTLFVDGKEIGPIILPQRGTDQWNNWGVSSGQRVKLGAGSHRFELRFLPADENMNGEVNRARVASLIALPLD